MPEESGIMLSLGAIVSIFSICGVLVGGGAAFTTVQLTSGNNAADIHDLTERIREIERAAYNVEIRVLREELRKTRDEMKEFSEKVVALSAKL